MSSPNAAARPSSRVVNAFAKALEELRTAKPDLPPEAQHELEALLEKGLAQARQSAPALDLVMKRLRLDAAE